MAEESVFQESDDATPMRPSRRDWLLKYAGAGLVTLAAAGVTSPSASADETDSDFHGQHRVEGAWRVQVAFQTAQNPTGVPGFVEQSLACFLPGGVMVESDGAGDRAHFGAWKRLAANRYVFHLVEFNYDPTSGYIAQIVVPNVEFEVDGLQFQSTSATTSIYFYDSNPKSPTLGKQVNTVVIPGVSVVTGDRLTSTWVPPAQFQVKATG